MEPVDAFLRAAVWHGGLDEAAAILLKHPTLPDESLHVAAVLGDVTRVTHFVASDPSVVHAKAGPWHAMPLVMLCLSRYLRLDAARSDAFLETARVLLDAGADPNGGFMTEGQFPEYETPLYGAAGVAHHEGMTRLLLERGANPNDEEVAYHAPEGYELGALKAVVETGVITEAHLGTMLLRKCDWHDGPGVRYLLGKGADPNFLSRWKRTPMLHSILRDNGRHIVQQLLDAGGDPTVAVDGNSGGVLAAWRGRGDLLKMFDDAGITFELHGADALVAACARGDETQAKSLAGADPDAVGTVIAAGGNVLAPFAGVGNAAGVGLLLDLGVPVDAMYEGDGYFDIAPDSTALHVACWRAAHAVVRLLIDRGADVHRRDGQGRTAIGLAVKACTDSFWMEMAAPDSVQALLDAGALGGGKG